MNIVIITSYEIDIFVNLVKINIKSWTEFETIAALNINFFVDIHYLSKDFEFWDFKSLF